MVAQIDAKYRSYGAAKTFRRFVSYALFEGRPHTTKGQWFNPVVFALMGTLKRIPSNSPLDRPIFITGLGRSGTTILGLLLSVHRNVGYLNEPKAIWKTIDSRSDVVGDYAHEGGQFRLTAAAAGATEQRVANRIFGHYLTMVRSSRLVDKYPELIFRIDYVRRLLPEARFVFISRNGADAVYSIDLWSKRLGTRTDTQSEDWWGRNDIKWNNLWEELIEPDAYFESVTNLDRAGLDHVNRAALEWIVTMREGLEQMARQPRLRLLAEIRISSRGADGDDAAAAVVPETAARRERR